MKLDFQTMLILFRDAARGLRALHEQGRAHRDIKPPNIGYKSLDPPFAVIVDLDHTAFLGYYDPSGIKPVPGTRGTIGYLAPEMEASSGSYSCAVDVFSLGCVGLELFWNDYHWKRNFNP